MPLTLTPLLLDAGVDPAQTLVIRHAFVIEPEESGLTGLHADSTHTEILAYTATQSSVTRRFPAEPPRFWVVFIKEGGDQARLWSVVENRGEIARDDIRRTFTSDAEVIDRHRDQPRSLYLRQESRQPPHGVDPRDGMTVASTLCGYREI